MSIHNFSNFENLNTLFTTIGNKLRRKLETVNLTQAQYDALTPAEKMNGKAYFITDAESGLTPSSGSSGGGSESYSTDEQECGTWVDGSTIYKKTFLIDSNKESTQTIDMNISNLDKIIKYEGGLFGKNNGNGVSSTSYRNLDGYYFSTAQNFYYDGCDVSIKNGKIIIVLQPGYFNTKSDGYGHITVWYTKSA